MIKEGIRDLRLKEFLKFVEEEYGKKIKVKIVLRRFLEKEEKELLGRKVSNVGLWCYRKK